VDIRVVLWFLALVFVVPGMLLVAVVVARSDDPSPLTGDVDPQPLVVEVTDSTRFDQYRVALTVNSTPPPVLRAGDVTGRVTDVFMAPGGMLVSGRSVIEVEDVARLAMVADGPLWRDLGSGDDGPDVERLQRFLTELGYDPGDIDGAVGGGTLVAIRAFNKDYGWGQPLNVFRSSAVIWIGETDFSVGEVLVASGDLLDGAGELASGPERVESVTVREPPDAATTVDAEWVLIVGDKSVPYIVGSRIIDDPEHAQVVADAVGDSEEPGGTVQLREPRQITVVPATAVVTGEAGGRCVYVPDLSGFVPVAVELVGGGVATVELPVSFTHKAVLANPREVIEAAPCG
jgi:peptidoglycan hydrolase-like protein with peptidoglycan-binding domain